MAVGQTRMFTDHIRKIHTLQIMLIYDYIYVYRHIIYISSWIHCLSHFHISFISFPHQFSISFLTSWFAWFAHEVNNFQLQLQTQEVLKRAGHGTHWAGEHWTNKGHHQTCRKRWKRRTTGISWSNIYMEVYRRIYICTKPSAQKWWLFMLLIVVIHEFRMSNLESFEVSIQFRALVEDDWDMMGSYDDVSLPDERCRNDVFWCIWSNTWLRIKDPAICTFCTRLLEFSMCSFFLVDFLVPQNTGKLGCIYIYIYILYIYIYIYIRSWRMVSE